MSPQATAILTLAKQLTTVDQAQLCRELLKECQPLDNVPGKPSYKERVWAAVHMINNATPNRKKL